MYYSRLIFRRKSFTPMLSGVCPYKCECSVISIKSDFMEKRALRFIGNPLNVSTFTHYLRLTLFLIVITKLVWNLDERLQDNHHRDKTLFEPSLSNNVNKKTKKFWLTLTIAKSANYLFFMRTLHGNIYRNYTVSCISTYNWRLIWQFCKFRIAILLLFFAFRYWYPKLCLFSYVFFFLSSFFFYRHCNIRPHCNQ